MIDPQSIMILALMLTNKCNFHCGHCMVNSSYDGEIASSSVIDKFIEMCSIWQPNHIYLLGGEVLLFPDIVENIVNSIKDFSGEIVIFSNGSFLMNDEMVKRVESMPVTIRISDDRFHRKFWSPSLKEKIENSKYWIASREENYEMIPVGRAYEEFKHLQYNLGCSLLTGFYDSRYPNNHRAMVMMNGDVNLYCATIEASLANVFEDDKITYDLLVEREKILHNYLARKVISKYEDTYMAKLCNECPHYKVDARHIYYFDKIVADTSDFCFGFEKFQYDKCDKK